MNGPGRWEQLALESIEIGLGDSDPALASLLAMFSRLATGEEMPAGEWIRTPLRHPPRRRRRRPGRTPRPLSAPLVWLVVSVALITVAVVLSHGGASGCAPAWTGGCAG
ncbi:MAG: hypothetical protein ACRDOU_11390 [Streptosporangiaceae bacterium]